MATNAGNSSRESFEPQPLVFKEVVFKEPSKIISAILSENLKLRRNDQRIIKPNLICISLSLNCFLEENESNFYRSLKDELMLKLPQRERVEWRINNEMPENTLILADTEIVKLKYEDAVDFMISKGVSYALFDHAMSKLKFSHQAV